MQNSPTRLMLTARALLCVCLAASAPAGARDRAQRTGAERDDRFQALWRDGSARVGKELRDWHDTKRQPSLDGQRLFDDNNPVQVLYDTTLDVAPMGAFVQFANGDVLPGRVVGGMPAGPATGLPQHLIVSVQAPLNTWDLTTTEIAIRPDQVVRVVLDGHGAGPVDPGSLLFRDGRKVRIRALRWVLGGLRALTEDGSLAAGWLELAEIHPPRVDTVASLLQDLTSPSPGARGAEALIGRIRTSHGAVLTYKRARVQIDRRQTRLYSQYHTVQPAWALHAIRVPLDEIVTRSYREADEIPLSLLPMRELTTRSFTGFVWPTRLNAGVRGGMLASGSRFADLGVGAHAYSEIAFQLPPHATRFFAWVGVDRAVGRGGCVKCRVYRDKAQGEPAWESGFLRGGEEPTKIGPIDLNDAKRLILVADFAHDDRPQGADPLDIRDEVAWLFPTVTVDLAAAASASPQPILSDAVPQLDGWSMAEADAARIGLTPFWSDRDGRWMAALRLDPQAQRLEDVKPLDLTRRVTVTAANAWLPLQIARDGSGETGFEIQVLVDGKEHGTIMNGNVRTSGVGDVQERIVTLGQYAGKQTDLTLRLTPHGDRNRRPSGIIFGDIQPQPLIENLPTDGAPIKPDVPITSLGPVKVQWANGERPMNAGRMPNGDPLTVRDYPFADGYAIDDGAQITYALKPDYNRLVAVIGLAQGTSHVGPFRVLLDGEVYWDSGIGYVPDGEDPDDKRAREKGDSGRFNRQTRPRQVDIDIPPGHKTITLLIKPSGGVGAWANAGFMTP